MMQTTIYLKEEDEYLLEKVAEKANRERKSKSAVILSVLEEYFEAELTPAEILYDLGEISRNDLKKISNKCDREEIEEKTEAKDSKIRQAFDLSQQQV